MRSKRSACRSERVQPRRRLAIEPLEDRRMLSGLVGDSLDGVALAGAATDQVQQVSTSPAALVVSPGQTFSFDVNYTTSPANPALTGLGLRMHFNSARLSWKALTSVLPSPISNQPPNNDTSDYDGDPSTDKYVLVAWSDSGGQWPGSLPARLFTANFTAKTVDPGTTYVRFTASSSAAGWTFSSTPAAIQFPGHVVDRHVFYNHSSFDGNDAAANANDDNAIAPDKVALLAGQQASFQNYTTYSRGINGVMIDFDDLPGTPLLSDFQLRVGNSSTPSSWTNPSAAPTISVRTNVGTGQVDRLTLVWPDGAILGKWLQVSVLATPRTGLASADLFYVGSAPGETGNSPSNASVEGADYVTTRAAARTFTGSAAITDQFDFNRDSRVDASDVSIVRSYMGHLGWSLKLITPPSSAAASTAPAADEPAGFAASSGDALVVASVAAAGDCIDPAALAPRIDWPEMELASPAVAATGPALAPESDVDGFSSLANNDAWRCVASRVQRTPVDLFAGRLDQPADGASDLFARDSIFQSWDDAAGDR